MRARTEVVYISPLKALSNDIQKNLAVPLAEIAALAKENGLSMMEIRVTLRTGDSLAKERQAMLKNPPHILVTTPESFYILLTAEKSRALLSSVNTVIVDEIHALVNDKRGVHLALSLERLQVLTLMPPVRIGLSATQKPIEQVADFLAGNQRTPPVIVNVGHRRLLDLKVEIPQFELGAIASNEMWHEIYERLTEYACQHRSILIFVNTRRLAERVAHHLTERLGQEQVAAHHGSLSRKLRLQAENKLKNGELKALVATASLELGIDIGMIDLVCLIGSPRSIAVSLQRIGRSGHWRGAIPKGRIFATTRDELIECAALILAIRQGDLDQLRIPSQSIDILAQQIVAACATGEWREEELFHWMTRAYPFAELARETFNEVLDMLSSGIAGSRGRYSAYLFRDSINGIVRARRGSRLTAITSGGAIPENGLFTVIAEPEGVMVGTLDEDFAVESNRGDIILLGSSSWRIQRIESSGRVIVEDAHGAPPSVPFWRGEAPARSDELSAYVSHLRQKLDEILKNVLPTGELTQHPQVQMAMAWLENDCSVSANAALQMVNYILQGRALLGHTPTQSTIIAERFFDESGGMQIVIHSPFGARMNKAWGLALRKRFCRSFNFELQAAATDNGVNIALAEQHSFPLMDVFQFLHPNTLKEVLIQAVLQSPLFNTRWRWNAMRALAIVRFRNGKKIPPNILRILSDDLLAAVFPDAAACQDNLGGRDIELPAHPLIQETIKDVLTEALDLNGLQQLLERILQGSVQCIAVDTPAPSVFAYEILNANPYAFLDDAPLEERRARAVELRRILPDSILESAGALSPAAILQVQTQAWPDIRSADELHDALQTLIAVPADEAYRAYFLILLNSKRVGESLIGDRKWWWAVEKYSHFMAVYQSSDLSDLANAETIEMIRGWMFHSGPITAETLSEKLGLTLSKVNHALIELEASGVILRGKFSSVLVGSLQWCERRLLARIHRLTICGLRQEIEPVSTADFLQWLLTWQHLAPGTQLRGEQGLLEIIRQLQGFEIPANAWEREILAKRVVDYDSAVLDRLCLMGMVGWGRLSRGLNGNLLARVAPSSISPITFFVRDEPAWFIAPGARMDILKDFSGAAQSVFDILRQKGACFFNDIERGCGQIKASIENALWELVASGLVTADGFDNLRALIDPKRRSGKKGQWARASFSVGRWSLLVNHVSDDVNVRIESHCWILLKRYGVIFRDLLKREDNAPPWRELLPVLRRLEARGEIRGGHFVQGFSGEQFALPYVVESLRTFRNKSDKLANATVAAVDPLNLIGVLTPEEKVPALSGKCVNLDFLL